MNRLVPVRKTSVALSTLALAALALTGCSASADSASCDRTGSAHGIDASAIVKGEVGKAPQVTINAPTYAQQTSFTDLVTGDGDTINESSQLFLGTVQLYSGATGAQVASSGDGLGLLSADTIDQQFPGIGKGLVCATAGSRVLSAVPAKDLPEQVQASLPEDDSIFAVTDIVDTTLPHAEGRALFHDAHGLPTVVRAANGRPGVIVPRTDAPTKLVSQTLIEGSGEEITEKDAPVYAYTAVSWDSREVTNSTWDAVPSINLQDVPEEVAAQITSATVGSQLMVVVPGEGDAGATVYVVDVLGALPAAG